MGKLVNSINQLRYSHNADTFLTRWIKWNFSIKKTIENTVNWLSLTFNISEQFFPPCNSILETFKAITAFLNQAKRTSHNPIMGCGNVISFLFNANRLIKLNISINLHQQKKTQQNHPFSFHIHVIIENHTQWKLLLLLHNYLILNMNLQPLVHARESALLNVLDGDIVW